MPERQDRAVRERTRRYQARRADHERRVRRRRRDNIVAGVAGGLLVAAAFGAQAVYFVAGPAATPAATPGSTAPADPAPSLQDTPPPAS